MENPDNHPGPLERQFSNTAAESFRQRLCELGVLLISTLKIYALCMFIHYLRKCIGTISFQFNMKSVAIASNNKYEYILFKLKNTMFYIENIHN